jgi:threonine 3-dehydrogenase
MRAVVKTEAVGGPAGTRIMDLPRPVADSDEVLIRVSATAICGTDLHIYRWDPSIRSDIVPPRVFGHEFCGFIESIGDDAARSGFSEGDYVSAEMHVVCGECVQCRSGLGHVCPETKVVGLHADGTFAEFVKVPASNVVLLDPKRIPIQVGAFLDALGNAVHATQTFDLDGKSVLITGFGPIGAMCASIVEHSGARTVIVTDVSEHALETARRWAAARALENFHAFNAVSAVDDLREAVLEITERHGVDVVLEMSGAPSAVNLGLDLVTPGGCAALLGIPSGPTLLVEEYAKNIILKGITLQGVVGRRMYDTWKRMLALLEDGLDVGWIVQAEFDGLDDFHEGMASCESREALKVVFYPHGR